MIFLSSTLGKKNPTAVKLSPFESGVEPFSLPIGRLAIKFYLTAILFIHLTLNSSSSIHGPCFTASWELWVWSKWESFLVILMAGYVTPGTMVPLTGNDLRKTSICRQLCSTTHRFSQADSMTLSAGAESTRSSSTPL